MGLRDTQTVDLIMRHKATGRVDLIVHDAGEVDDEGERYELLLEKLASYAEYVCSGQLAEEHPDVADDPRIVVVTIPPPSEEMTNVESIRPRDDPDRVFPVIFMSESEYGAQGQSRGGEGAGTARGGSGRRGLFSWLRGRS